MRNDQRSGVWGQRTPRRVFLQGLAAAAGATGIVSLAGCSSASPAAPTAAGAPAASAFTPAASAAATAAATARPVKFGGVFRTATVQDTADLDPHLNVTQNLHVMGPGAAYSKLLKFKLDASVKPGEFIATGDLAESWEQADDVTYLFKMRRDAKWQNIPPLNGRAVVAQDVKYSFERQIELRTLAGRLAGVARIEAVDPATLKITLERPDADILGSLAQYTNRIVAREAVELKGDLKEGPTIGSGPWIFEKWERNSIATLIKNPDYYVKGLPRLDRLEFPRIADASTRAGAFRSQQLDVLGGLTRREAESFRQANPDQIVYETFKSTNGQNLAINAGKPPFTDIRLRQAIFKAINKQQIIDTVVEGQGWYYPGVFMPREDYYLPEAEMRELYKQDVPGAKRLLAEAGIAPGLEFEVLVSQTSDAVTDIAQLVKSQLAEIGITITLRPVDTPTFTRLVFTEASHNMAFGAQSPSTSTNGELLNTRHSTGTQNRGNLKDPTLDALIERQAGMTRDPEGRKKILLDIQRYIVNSASHITLYGILEQRLRWKYVQDWFLTTGIDEVYPQIWLDK